MNAEALAPFIIAVDHLGIAVSDLEVSIAFYTDNLGLRTTHIEINEEQNVREAMLSPQATLPGGTAIQLLAPTHPTSHIGRFLAKHGPGLHHVAYRVSDVDAAMEALRAKGLRLLYDEPKRGTANSRINFVHPKDADGVLVEIIEPTE